MVHQLLVSHVPLTLTSFMINFGVMVKKAPGMSQEEEDTFDKLEKLTTQYEGDDPKSFK